MLMVLSSPSLPRAMAPAAAAGGVSGTVTNSVGGSAVSGGTVQLIRSGSVVDTSVPDGSGAYSFSSVEAGDVVRMQPKLAFSVADAGEFTVDPGDTQDFSLLPAGTGNTDDFQSYDADADFQSIGSSGTNGCFWDNNISAGSAGGHDGSINPGCCGFSIGYSATGGPLGDKAMVYNFAARGTCPMGCSMCGSSSYGMYPRLNPAGDLTGEWWVRTYEKWSSGFKPGKDDCLGSSVEYKHLFFDFDVVGHNPASSVPQIEILIQNGNGSGAPISGGYGLRAKLLDYNGSYADPWDSTGGTVSTGDPSNVPDSYIGAPDPGTPYDGSWHSWVVGIVGLGQVDQPTLYVYVDDVLMVELTGPFIPSQTTLGRPKHTSYDWLTQSGNKMAIQMGANINNGPSASQERYFREFGIYRSRPSTIAGLAV